LFGVAAVLIPSIIPSPPETVYLAEDDYGHIGRSFRETELPGPIAKPRCATFCQYHNPIRVVAFNTVEGWSRDVSYEMATELRRHSELEGFEIGGTLNDFVEAYSPARQLSRRLT
jgi:hypothetical protein